VAVAVVLASSRSFPSFQPTEKSLYDLRRRRRRRALFVVRGEEEDEEEEKVKEALPYPCLGFGAEAKVA
tara:strand:- start:245 stop:451 length:207 start_codon:yes stop_codon:yes gene_type:complete